MLITPSGLTALIYTVTERFSEGGDGRHSCQYSFRHNNLPTAFDFLVEQSRDLLKVRHFDQTSQPARRLTADYTLTERFAEDGGRPRRKSAKFATR